MSRDTVESTLSAISDVQSVSNVILFISDSLRYDHLPPEVADIGVEAEAVAPSTFTASSLPSITSGQYPASHGVWMFDDTLAEKPELLSLGSHDVGFDAEGIWTKLPPAEKPPLRINRLSEERKLAELETPFVHVVHDMGPHAPYGFENGVFESTKEYFKQYERRRDQLRSLYKDNCSSSAQRFLDMYEEIERNGDLEDTLLVFTSDHGEALGETANGGRFGHGHPLSPETVKVPVVFCGAGLPEGATYTPLLSSVDIAPTLLSAVGREPKSYTDGVDIWSELPEVNRLLRSEVWQHIDVEKFGYGKELTVYCATSAWNRSGGHVFHRKSALERVAGIAYDDLFRGYSPAWKANFTVQNAIQLAIIAAGSHFEYGTPDFTPEEAKRVVPDNISANPDHQAEDLNQDQLDHLKDMGYL